MQDRVEAPFKCICSTREKDKCFPTHENHNKRKVHESVVNDLLCARIIQQI